MAAFPFLARSDVKASNVLLKQIVVSPDGWEAVGRALDTAPSAQQLQPQQSMSAATSILNTAAPLVADLQVRDLTCVGTYYLRTGTKPGVWRLAGWQGTWVGGPSRRACLRPDVEWVGSMAPLV